MYNLVGRLGGSVIKRLPLAQGVIPAFWDRAPYQAPSLGACFFLSHSPCWCGLSHWLSLSLSNKLKKKNKNKNALPTLSLIPGLYRQV